MIWATTIKIKPKLEVLLDALIFFCQGLFFACYKDSYIDGVVSSRVRKKIKLTVDDFCAQDLN